jgi:hypothetical protein
VELTSSFFIQNKSLEETAAAEVLEECGYSISPDKLGEFNVIDS